MNCKILTAWLFALGPLMASAQSQWEAAALPSRMWLTTEERTPQGAIFNQERGALEGVQLRLAKRWGGWQLGLVREQLEGDLLYLGRTQIGFPVITFSHYGWQAQGVFVERQWGGAGVDDWRVGLGTRLQNRRIDRKILESPFNLPLQEVLRERAVGVDVAVRLPIRSVAPDQFGALRQWLPSSIEVKASRERAHRSSLDVNSFGVFDPIQLEPTGSGYRSNAWQLKWRLNPNVRVLWSKETQTLAPGESPMRIWTQMGVPASTVQYPGALLKAKTTRVGAVLEF